MPDQPDITIGVDIGAPATEPSASTSERYHCPISTCSWTFDIEAAPVIDPQVLAHVFGPGVMALRAVDNHRAKIERALEEHCNSHAIVEYVAEISQLRDLCVGLTVQMQQLDGIMRISSGLRPETDHVFHPAAPKLGQYPITGL